MTDQATTDRSDIRHSSCPSGKIKHKTAAAAEQWQDARYPGCYRRAYRCPHCGRFHISLTPLAETGVLRRMIQGSR